MQSLSDNVKGALLMMCSMAAFTLNDTCIKLLGPEVPLFQMLFLRGILSSLLIWGLANTVYDRAPELVRRIERYAEEDPHYWQVPDLLRRMAADGTTFADMNEG